MMTCPLVDPKTGLTCQVEGSHHHSTHSVYDPDANRWVNWYDDVPETPPGARVHGGFSKAELANMAEKIEDGITGTDHPATSHAAGRSVAATSQRERLRGLLLLSGAEGLTSYEASNEMGMSPNQLATRMMELRMMGAATRLAKRRETTKGNFGHVHVLTQFINGQEIDIKQ